MTDEVAPPRIYFDTTIFCDAFEGQAEKAGQLKSIFIAAKKRAGLVVTSELTLAELLGKEAPGKGWAWQTRFYLDLIVFDPFIDLRPVTRDILLSTGDYRRAARQEKRNVKLPDAIHVVTAIKAGCQYIFTSDKRFAVPRPLEIVISDSEGMAFVLKALNA